MMLGPHPAKYLHGGFNVAFYFSMIYGLELRKLEFGLPSRRREPKRKVIFTPDRDLHL
jgi:hypothetical protein